MTQNRCILVGLPLSGKSSFIAALWHVVERNEISSEYKITTLPEDREYLNFLRDSWLNCKPPERNKTEHIQNITLSVSSKKGNMCEFIFPDVAGELFETQFDNRRIKVEYSEIIKSSNGILLFINPDYLKRPITIREAVPIIGSEESDSTDDGLGEAWTYKDAPTQVILVDLLQMISELSQPIRVAIIVSAWDQILNLEDENYKKKTPDQWVEKELPLLSQYLKANQQIFNHIYFGISAQGGMYKNDNSELHNFENQSERIKVQWGSKMSNDISLPIKWVLNE